jgi:hypothetical protein
MTALTRSAMPAPGSVRRSNDRSATAIGPTYPPRWTGTDQDETQ